MTNIQQIADEYGLLKAQETELQKKISAAKEKLVASGLSAVEGNIFRTTISVFDRSTLDSSAARAKLEELGVSRQWITSHTKTTEVVTVKAVARNGENLKAVA